MSTQNFILISLRIEPELLNAIKKYKEDLKAKDEESTVQSIIRKAIKEFFSKRDINWKNKIV